MNNSIKKQRKNLAKDMPKVLELLSNVSYHAQKLHDYSTLEKIAEALDTDRQSIHYHVKKVAKKKEESK